MVEGEVDEPDAPDGRADELELPDGAGVPVAEAPAEVLDTALVDDADVDPATLRRSVHAARPGTPSASRPSATDVPRMRLDNIA